VLTEITFSMDTRSGAPFIVGSMLVPHAKTFTPYWRERGERSYVTVQVRSAVAEGLAQKLPTMHRSVRCIDRHEVATEQAG
jgi:hypothetical protein